MKSTILSLLAVGAIMVHCVSANAQDKADKKDPAKNIVTQFLKQLEKAELKEDETNKIKEMFQKVAKEVAGKRTEAGITPEMMKKRAEAQKAAKEAGKKGKEAQESVESAMGMNADQSKVFKETESMLAKVKVEIGKTLTAEQIAKLPEPAQNSLKEKPVKGKGKKADK